MSSRVLDIRPSTPRLATTPQPPVDLFVRPYPPGRRRVGGPAHRIPSGPVPARAGEHLTERTTEQRSEHAFSE